MRNFIKIVESGLPKKRSVYEQADADNMFGDASQLDPIGRRDGQEFTDRGRGNVRPRAGMDARFSDNPMDDEQLDEFAGAMTDPGFEANPDDIEMVHDELNRHGGYSDQEIMQGVELDDEGKQKLAAKLGVSHEVVDMYIASLIQNLRDDDEKNIDAITDDYYTTMGEGADVPMVVRTISERYFAENGKLEDKKSKKDCDKLKKKASNFKGKKKDVKETKKVTKRPFDSGVMVERYSYERDALNNVTVRDAKTGKEKYVQGAQATQILAQLDGGANQDQLLAPLMESMNIEDDSDYMAEIEAPAGTYNFEWVIGAEHGSGTAMYRTDTEKPSLKLVSVRNEDGDEISNEIDDNMHRELINQARDFIGNE